MASNICTSTCKKITLETPAGAAPSDRARGLGKGLRFDDPQLASDVAMEVAKRLQAEKKEEAVMGKKRPRHPERQELASLRRRSCGFLRVCMCSSVCV